MAKPHASIPTRPGGPPDISQPAAAPVPDLYQIYLLAWNVPHGGERPALKSPTVEQSLAAAFGMADGTARKDVETREGLKARIEKHLGG